MYHRFFASLATVYLLLMTYGLAGAANPVSVWVALSETGAAHQTTAEVLRAETSRALPGRVEWRIAHWSNFSGATPKPHWIVAVGTTAQRGMQALHADAAAPPPLLAILVPRPAFERMAAPRRLRDGSLSAVFLDQPPGRQLDLIRLALPAVSHVGILVGGESKSHAATLEKAAQERGMQLFVSTVGEDGLYPALQSALTNSGALLALPDPAVFNGQTAANILTAAYRRQVPLVGFSPAYVKAGALLAVYSTPVQIGICGAKVLRQALATGSFPSPQWPCEFTVSVNQDVARSLNLMLDEAWLTGQLREGRQP